MKLPGPVWGGRIAAASSAALLWASFYPLAWQEAAWLAFVPLLAALPGRNPVEGFRLGFLAGALFWLASILWLTHVTIPGWFFLALYCALYTGLFASACAGWFARFGTERILPNVLFIVYAGALWAGLEWVRCHVFTGFAWNPLAATQYRSVAILQLAAWGGAGALSALVASANAGIGLTVARYIAQRGHWGRRPHPEIMVTFLAIGLVFYFGAQRLRAVERGDRVLRAGLVQIAIPQDDKWDPTTVGLIYERLMTMTLGALRAAPLDLVIWPETALPDDVASSEPSYQVVYDLATNGVPMLVGSMDTYWPDTGRPIFYNSSFLFDADGMPLQVYNKQHLVIFGEYVPLQRYVPFINAFTPIQESFTAGASNVMFELASPSCRFSVLICFEDTVAHLARKAVNEGAELLVNQTNDAWFDPSAASRQHMVHSVLRAVELGVPVIRVANTGVTCWIDRRGVVRSVLEDANRGTIFPGFLIADVELPPANTAPTVYARHGDRPLVLAGLAAFLIAWWTLRRRPRPPSVHSQA